MTKAQLRKKFRQLKRSTSIGLDRYLEAAMKSGAFDLPSAEDNYRLAKNIMCAALRDEQCQWGPLMQSDRREINNIYRCTYPDRSTR